MNTDMLLAYIALGVGAALAAMTWPFRRGPLGVAVVLVAGAGGSVGGAALSHAFLSERSPTHLVFATAGAMTALLIAHGLWFWIAARSQRQHLATRHRG
jgi:hypothetical protein